MNNLLLHINDFSRQCQQNCRHYSKLALQLGNTRGGNDGSVFIPEGAVDILLSWPGVYSHSFIEKIHRFDLEALTKLIVAIVRDW